MVVTCTPATALSGVMHERTARRPRCTVQAPHRPMPQHLGRRAVRSCITPISAAAGAQVTTIEGLSTDGQHPLQKAWVQTQAPQCGYCQSGQIMQAAALIRRFPNPSDEDIDSVMNGNLCRCMAYVRIRQAIKIAAAEVQGAASHA